jgi:uncharacterized protein (PEP-CTERM system associated)
LKRADITGTDTVRSKSQKPMKQSTLSGLNCLLLASSLLGSGTAFSQAQEPPTTSPTVDDKQAEELAKRKVGGSLLPGVRSAFSYQTNASLEADGARSNSNDFLLEITPYIRAESKAPRLNYLLDYSITNIVRARGGDKILGRQRLQSNLNASVAGDWLWLDLGGLIASANNDPFGPLSSDPGISFTNVATIKTFSFSPYIRSRIGGFADSTWRYGFQTSKLTSINLNQAPRTHSLSSDIKGTQIDGGNWNWSWSGELQRRQYGNSNIDRKFSNASVYIVPTPSLRVSGSAIYDEISGVTSRDGKTRGIGPGVGIDWNPLDRTQLSVKASKRYYGNTASVDLYHSSSLFVFGANYSKGINGSIDSSIFSIEPGAALNPSAAITNNPAYRSLIAQNLRLGYGIPYGAGLVEDSFIKEQKAQLTGGIVGIRNSITLGASAIERASSIFVSAVPTGGSGPRGGGFGVSGRYVGLLRIYTGSLDHGYKFDARSNWLSSLSYTETETPSSVGLGSRSLTASTGFTTQITPDTQAGAGLRYTKGKLKNLPVQPDGSLTTKTFDNASIYGTVNVRF